MRPVEFGEALATGTRFTPFSDDKPDRFFAVIKFWIDETLGASLRVQNGVPSYEVEDAEGADVAAPVSWHLLGAAWSRFA